MRLRTIKPWLRSPPPPALLAGREDPLARLRNGLAEVPIALVLGLGGIGKSALARAYAARFGGPVLVTNVGTAPPSRLVDDGRAALATEEVGRPESEDARLADLGHRIESRRALWVVENLERLPEDDRVRWLTLVGGVLRAGRLIATSRERPSLDASAPDHLELRLRGLDNEGASKLWHELDLLHGERAGFLEAFVASKGNPLLLRRAHTGQTGTPDPIGELLESLSRDERQLAQALAIAQIPLPQESFGRLLPRARAHTALRGLERRLAVDLDSRYEVALDPQLVEPVRKGIQEAGLRLWERKLVSELAARGAALVRAGRSGELVRAAMSLRPQGRRPAGLDIADRKSVV